MTREHKILAGVLAVGCLALGADRLVFSGETAPQAADAEVSSTVEAVVSTAEPGEVADTLQALPAELPTGPSIASLLVAAESHSSDKTEPRDAFVVDQSWFDSQPESNTSVEDAIKKFISQHTLNAVMNGRIAIINGETYKVGESLANFKLVVLNKEGVAIFQYHGQRVTLRLYKDAPSKTR